MAPSLTLALVLALSAVVGQSTRSAPPRIQFLAPDEFPLDAGCAGLPVGDSRVVLACGSEFAAVKIDGAVLRLTPSEGSEFPGAGERRGDRIRQKWTSGVVSVLLDLVLESDCPPDEECDGSVRSGDLTVKVGNGAGAAAQKTIRIQIDCGC